jgi:hypothetical protein
MSVGPSFEEVDICGGFVYRDLCQLGGGHFSQKQCVPLWNTFSLGGRSPEKTLYTIAPAIINGEYGVSIREKILEEFNIDKNAVDGKDNDGKRQ